MKITALLFTLFLSLSVAAAAEVTECAGSKVYIAFSSSLKSPEGVESILTVSRSGQDTTLRYDTNIDFIGAECRKNRRGEPLIVFQAYCGGSGCRDLDNFGIIDPSDLRILLVPNDWNRGDAKKILGDEVAPIDDVFSVADGTLIRHVH